VDGTRFALRFFGSSGAWLKEMTEKYALETLVEAQDYIPRQVVKERLLESHAVLLRIFRFAAPTKLYEALALGKTCLAIGESPESARIILDYSPSSFVLDVEDSEGICRALGQLFGRWQRGGIKDEVSDAFVRDFSWEARARQMASVLGQLADSPAEAEVHDAFPH
jgi:hypothetical protein